MRLCVCVSVCLCVCDAVVTCSARPLVSGALTTPTYDVTFSDVIDGRCPDGADQLMNNGLGFDAVKCTELEAKRIYIYE